MPASQRNNVHVSGVSGPMMFVHGFGCDRPMRRLLAPHCRQKYHNQGHCPHLSAPGANVAAIDEFLASPQDPLHGRSPDPGT